MLRTEEELLLADSNETVTKIIYGLTKKGIRKLAYKFAVAYQTNFHSKRNEPKLAGEEWTRLFLRRTSKECRISIRNSEKTSLSSANVFNKTNMGRFIYTWIMCTSGLARSLLKGFGIRIKPGRISTE